MLQRWFGSMLAKNVTVGKERGDQSAIERQIDKNLRLILQHCLE
jgi:hypothetical protein